MAAKGDPFPSLELRQEKNVQIKVTIRKTISDDTERERETENEGSSEDKQYQQSHLFTLFAPGAKHLRAATTEKKKRDETSGTQRQGSRRKWTKSRKERKKESERERERERERTKKKKRKR